MRIASLRQRGSSGAGMSDRPGSEAASSRQEPGDNSSVQPLLDVRDLSIGFPSGKSMVCPVRGVSFTLARGDRLGLVGESGSGKSLTALAMMRLIRPPGKIVSGEILLDGRDLTRLSERQMAEVRGGEIAMIYQDPLSALNPLRTIGRQICEAITTHERNVSSAVARRRAIELLRDVGVAHAERRFDSYPHEFSGGMRQRVVIAMALSTNPKLVIADEPTTALDVTTQVRIIELLWRLVEGRNVAVILITHDLGVAAGFCSEVAVMYAGRIVERARADMFYKFPVHPYAEALLASICDLRTDIGAPMPAIAGQPPRPGSLPDGCAFHPRCRYAVEECRGIAPPVTYLPGETPAWVECHLAEQRLAVRSGRS